VTDAGRLRLDESAAAFDVLLMKAFAAHQRKVVELRVHRRRGSTGEPTAVVVPPQGVRRFLTLGQEYLARNALDFIDFKLPSLT